MVGDTVRLTGISTFSSHNSPPIRPHLLILLN